MVPPMPCQLCDEPAIETFYRGHFYCESCTKDFEESDWKVADADDYDPHYVKVRFDHGMLFGNLDRVDIEMQLWLLDDRWPGEALRSTRSELEWVFEHHIKAEGADGPYCTAMKYFHGIDYPIAKQKAEEARRLVPKPFPLVVTLSGRVKLDPDFGKKLDNIALWEGRAHVAALTVIQGLRAAAAWRNSHLLDHLMTSRDTLLSAYLKYHAPFDPHWDFSERNYGHQFAEDLELRSGLRSEYIKLVTPRAWHLLVEQDPELSRVHACGRLQPPDSDTTPLSKWFPSWVPRTGEVPQRPPITWTPAWEAHVASLGSRIAEDLGNTAEEQECTIMCFLHSKRLAKRCLRDIYIPLYRDADRRQPLMAEITDGSNAFTDWGLHYEYRRRLTLFIWHNMVERYNVLHNSREYLTPPTDDLTFLGMWFPRWILNAAVNDYRVGLLEVAELPWLGGENMEIDDVQAEEP